MSPIYVLDTGVLVSTWTDKKVDSTFITTPSIIGEVRNRLSRFRAETISAREATRTDPNGSYPRCVAG